MFETNNCTQEVIDSSNVYQAGRDNVITNNLYQFSDIEFYEDDIKDIIIEFSNSISKYNNAPPPDFSILKINKKNKINNLSPEYNDFIKENSLSFFGKIKAFLYSPCNSEYLDMYLATTTDLQEIFLSNRHMIKNFEQFFFIFSQYVLKHNRSDKSFMKKRKHVSIFFHFMYYNCDIGLKEEKDYS